MFVVYVLENPHSHSWYIGYTSDLRRRLQEHQLNNHRGWRLIYFEGYRHKMDAVGREKFLKGGSGRQYLKKQLKNYIARRGTEAVKRG